MYLALCINAILILLAPMVASLKCIRYHETCVIFQYRYDPKYSNNLKVDPVVFETELEVITYNNSIIMKPPSGLCKNIETVRKIYFTDGQLYNLQPTTFAFCSNVEEIILKRNFISELPDGIFNGVDNLLFIDLSYNRFTKIGGNVFKNLNNLVRIDLSHNKLKKIVMPSNVFPVNLRHLDLSFNKLRSFYGNDLRNILTLNLNNNWLTYIKLNSNITTLNAANNKLAGLFSNSSNLRWLSLKNNCFDTFDAINNLPDLVYLDFSENPMQDITWKQTNGAFTRCSKLKTLILKSVNLSPLYSFIEYNQLEILDISSNNLTSIDILNVIPRLNKIKYLKLNNNNLNLTTFQRMHIIFSELNAIDISENNWNCNNLMNVIETIDKLQIEIIIDDANLNITGTNIRGIRCLNVTESLNEFNEMELITTTILDLTTLNYSSEIVNTQDDLSDAVHKQDGLSAAVREKIDELQIIINKSLQHVTRMRLIVTILVISIGLMLTIFIFSLVRKKVNCNTTSYKLLETYEPI